jgi:LysM repeat protein
LRRSFALVLGIAILIARPAVAGIELAGSTGANFLTVNPGASLVGMGSTGVAGYPDLSAMTWNPAALGMMNESQLMFSHMPLPNAASQEWMSFGGRTGEAPTRWALSARYEGGSSFQVRDPLGQLTGTFNSPSLALGVNAARAIDRHTVVGMGAKFVNENHGSGAGYGGTFDIGILFHLGPLSLGAAAQNMGGSIRYDSLAYSMPRNLGAGLALADLKHGLRATLDFNHPSAYYEDLRAGAEWIWRERVALRVGYRQELNAYINDPMNGASFGLGGGGHGLWLDYAFVASADGTTQQRIALRVSPKAWGMSLASGVDDPNSTGASSSPPSPAASNQTSAPKPASGAATSSASSGAANSAPAPPAAASPAAASPVASSPTVAPAPAASNPPSPKAVAPATLPTPVAESAVKANDKPVRIYVQKGETLESIAKRLGTTKAAIMMENNLVSEKLHSGQELRIPSRP